jgi:hypothetical protein
VQAISVDAAIQDWLRFRETNGLGNDKPKLMGGKLLTWCKANSVTFLYHEKKGTFLMSPQGDIIKVARQGQSGSVSVWVWRCLGLVVACCWRVDDVTKKRVFIEELLPDRESLRKNPCDPCTSYVVVGETSAIVFIGQDR